MTTATSTQSLSLDAVLASHGIASVDDAREQNVFHACGACGSIKTCAPAPGQTREEQRDLLIANFEGMDECCEDGDDYLM